MTDKEKREAIKIMLASHCMNTTCSECELFMPKDDTDDEFFCGIRDKNNLIPVDEEWDKEKIII